MVNIGVLGDVGTGNSDMLRLFVKYVEGKTFQKKFKTGEAQIVKGDFSGEATLPGQGDEKATKSIHPSRVVFRIGEKLNTLFAPGGDDRPLVRMGITTVSRIARLIVAVFDVSRDIDDQFDFYSAVRFIPRTIIVALHKVDLLGKDMNKKIEEYKKRIGEYFSIKRQIKVEEFYITVTESKAGMQDQNDALARSIIDAVINETCERI